jgi:hypothetical protein
MNNANTTSKREWSEPVAGFAIGTMVGLILGLSATEIVSSVIGTLTALLLAYVGLKSSAQQANRRLNPYRICLFALGFLVFLPLGIIVRSHNLLGASIERQVLNWTDAGFDDQRAEIIVMYQVEGILPKGWQATRSNKPISQSVLFSIISTSDYDKLNPSRYNGDEAKVLKAWRVVGKRDERWKLLADLAEKHVQPGKRYEFLTDLLQALREKE